LREIREEIAPGSMSLSSQMNDPKAAVDGLIEPLNRDSFSLLRRGIFESAEVDVMQNEQCDFAFLHPRPSMDYENYAPRSERLKLKSSRGLEAMQERLAKIASHFEDAETFLEIGAADGSFLNAVSGAYPDLRLACVEPDLKTKAHRDAIAGLTQFSSLAHAGMDGARFDIVGLFHVFEHIERPDSFLGECSKLLRQNGKIIIEVPALTDPLLKIYKNPAYEAFYFQKQHPFVYSGASLSRVLRQNGYGIDAVIPYQRYGIDNHLAWLVHGKPGGDPFLRDMFGPLDRHYRAVLEQNGTTDTVMIVARATR
jgi:SAM-dependent methyltransferase